MKEFEFTNLEYNIRIKLNGMGRTLKLKGTVSVILSEHLCNGGNAWFTTVPFKSLALHRAEIVVYYEL